jgi:hypothetical protein
MFRGSNPVDVGTGRNKLAENTVKNSKCQQKTSVFILAIMLDVIMLGIAIRPVMLSAVIMLNDLSSVPFMTNVVMVSVIMLSVVMLSAVMMLNDLC